MEYRGVWKCDHYTYPNVLMGIEVLPNQRPSGKIKGDYTWI